MGSSFHRTSVGKGYTFSLARNTDLSCPLLMDMIAENADREVIFPMHHAIVIACAALAVALLPRPAGAETPERWYEQTRVESGEKLYASNCAACHGARGEATPNWRQRDSDGTFPPPPLNGTAHTWHHSFRVIARQIMFGSPGGAGKMPAFQDKLTEEEVIDVIAWIQSLWPDEIYAHWWEIQQGSSQQ